MNKNINIATSNEASDAPTHLTDSRPTNDWDFAIDRKQRKAHVDWAVKSRLGSYFGLSKSFEVETSAMRYFNLMRAELSTLRKQFTERELQVLLSKMPTPDWDYFEPFTVNFFMQPGAERTRSELAALEAKVGALTPGQRAALQDACEQVMRRIAEGGSLAETAKHCGLLLAEPVAVFEARSQRNSPSAKDMLRALMVNFHAKTASTVAAIATRRAEDAR